MSNRLLFGGKILGKTLEGAETKDALLSKEKLLKQYAKEINIYLHTVDELKKKQARVYYKIGEKISKVKDIFLSGGSSYSRNPVNLAKWNAFWVWCDKNLKTSKNRPYARETIKTYLLMYKNPSYAKKQEEKAASQQVKWNELRGGIPAAAPLTKKVKTLKHIWRNAFPKVIQKFVQDVDQVNLLVTVWDKATNQSRDPFMQIVGLRYA